MYLKSSCCGQALLISLKDLVHVLEDNIGLKCDEAYLEDSAIRFLKDAYMQKKCICQPYKYIFIDLDDPTISVKRFMLAAKEVFNQKGKNIPVFGCGSQEGRQKT